MEESRWYVSFESLDVDVNCGCGSVHVGTTVRLGIQLMYELTFWGIHDEWLILCLWTRLLAMIRYPSPMETPPLHFHWKLPDTSTDKMASMWIWNDITDAILLKYWNSSVCPFCNTFSIQMSQWLVRQGPFSTRLQPVLSTCTSSSPDSASVSSRHQTESAAPLSSRQNLLGCPSKCLKPPTSCLNPHFLFNLRKRCQKMCSSIVCTLVKEQSVPSSHVAADTKIHVKMFMICLTLQKLPTYSFFAEVCL